MTKIFNKELKKYTCENCLFANEKPNGEVECDKVFLLRGRKITIPKDRIDKECPSHSHKPIEDVRNSSENSDIRNGEDSCSICGRVLDTNKTDTFEVIEEIKFKQNKICSICIEKER